MFLRQVTTGLPARIAATLLLAAPAVAAPSGGAATVPGPKPISLAPLLAAVETAPRTSLGALRPAASMFPLSAGLTYRGVEIGGRKLDATERLVQAGAGRHGSLWWAEQSVLAQGRLGHKNFSADGVRYGGRADLIGDASSPGHLAASFEVFQTGRGRATAGTDTVIYVGTQAETLALDYTQRTGRVHRRFRLDASRVQGGSERATVLGGGAGLDFPIVGRIDGSVTGTLLAASGSGGDALHPVIDAGLTFRPLSWLRLEAGAVVAPSGFAPAGTSLTGLTSFLIYRPGGAAQELSARRTGYGVLRLVLSRSF